MLDTIIKLLERFVVAHELIAAAALQKSTVELTVANNSADTVEIITKGDGGSEKAVKGGDKPKQEEDDLDNEEAAEIRKEIEREEKIKSRTERKPRATKPKAEPEPDLDKLREEIEVMAKHIGSGDSDDCADELDDLMDEYDVRSIKKLGDLQVQEFHRELKAIVAKYYDIEDDN